MFSIVIPTFNNINYLKICIDSIKKNSKYNHEIILHVNEGSDGTLNYIKDFNNINNPRGGKTIAIIGIPLILRGLFFLLLLSSVSIINKLSLIS